MEEEKVEHKEVTKEDKTDNKKKIIICSIAIALALITIALLLIFLLPKGEKYYIETNSSLEVVLEGQGEYAEGEEVTIKAEDIEGYRFRNWTLNGIEVSKDLEYTFKASDETDGTYTANYDKLFKITIATIENGSIITNITEAIKGEEVEIEVSPNVEYMLGEIYYIVEGTSVRVDIVDNKFEMPLGNVTIYATFVEELYNIETSVENGEIVLTSDRVSSNDIVEFTVKTNPLEEDYAYVVNRVYYKVNGDSQEHEITKNDDGYSFTMPSANVTIYAEIEKVVRYSGFMFTETGNTAEILQYNGNTAEVVIPSSYSKRTIDVEAEAPKPITFNTAEEFSEYMSGDAGTIVMAGFFYITTPLTERTFMKDYQTYMQELDTLAEGDETKLFPMTIEFVDYEVSYEDFLSLGENAQFALLGPLYEIMLSQTVCATISFNSGETFNIDVANVEMQGNSIMELLGQGNENMLPVKVSYGGKATIYTEGDDFIVTSIGDDAFYGCSSLTTVTFGENSQLTSIGVQAFRECSSLTSIEIPSGVTSIGEDAFSGCYALAEVYNYSDLIITKGDWRNGYVGDYAKVIYNASDLTGEKPESRIQTIDNVQYYVYGDDFIALAPSVLRDSLIELKLDSRTTSINQYAFSRCSSLTSIEIPSSVTSIDVGAFSGCSSLTSIEIPSGVTSIDSSAFSGCSNLKTVTFGDNSQLTSISYYAFSGCSSLISIEIPSNVTSIGDDAFRDCSSLTSIEIPSGVTSIGDWAFFGCSNLKTVTFGENSQLTNIGDDAFEHCSSLISIEIPSSVTSIDYGAFSGCSGLTTVTFGENSQLTSIGVQAFQDCSSLTSIEIPSSVTSIDYGAFRDCSSLTSIEIPSSVTSIDSNAFYGCSSLTSIEIPSGVTSIGEDAFSGCYALAEVYNYSDLIITKDGSNGYVGCYAKVIYNASDLTGEKSESRIQTIDNVQYYVYGDDFIALAPSVSRDSLIELKLDSRTTSINQYAFFGCSSLTSIEIPSSVTSIGSSAFYECTSLTTITFGDNSQLTSIGGKAFENCSNLTSIEIPSNVTSIGYDAFSGCSSLTSIEIPSGVTSIGYSAFQDCSSLTSIEIPSSVTSIGQWAFDGCSNLTTVTIDSAAVYKNLTSKTSCGYLIENAETIKVLKSVVDNPENTNTYLNNESNFTKTEEGEYYVYTVVVA